MRRVDLLYGNSLICVCLCAGCVVKSEDVGFLVKHLHLYASKWREIGTALDFHPGELDNIVHSLPGANVQRLLTELLGEWSQWPTATHSDLPTMERLRDALRSGLVGLGAEANTLYQKRTLLPSWYAVVTIWTPVLSCSVFYYSAQQTPPTVLSPPQQTPPTAPPPHRSSNGCCTLL